ncbi:OFA family MFS transporter OS=Streptomyces tendae OX=1932 GN=GUR47_01635 PE=4 SV=1 [Streptomyces tendae]
MPDRRVPGLQPDRTKNIYRVDLGVAALRYTVIALFADSSKPPFVLYALVGTSFHGGGFATAPAYLKDLFGHLPDVGSDHGR